MGFAVIIPMRRSYGNSEGDWAEGFGSCSHPMYLKAGLEGAKDLIAAVEYMKKLPYLDAGKVVLLGLSTGGFASLAAASIGFHGLLGVINFSGVRGTPKPDFICQEHLLIDAIGKYGSTSRVPTLWYYSENDHYIPERVARKMFDAYTQAGGRGSILLCKQPLEKKGTRFSQKKRECSTGCPQSKISSHLSDSSLIMSEQVVLRAA